MDKVKKNRHFLGVAADYKNELERIVKNVLLLRSLKKGKETSWENAAEWHLKYSYLHGSPVLALTVTLSPSGCDWARQGGCTMCGEFEGSNKRNNLMDDPKFHIAQFASAISNPKVWATANKENKPVSWLRINQEGNYINSQEMNHAAQEKILNLATKIKGIKRITIESRPQFINKETVKFLRVIFDGSGIELEIGMGIEAENDVIRNICVNKAETKKRFEEAAFLLNANGILPLAYVLLKPPFITESEAIDEAVRTARFANEIGFLRISFEPMSIHGYTLVDALQKAGYYKVPWLWSVIEVTKQCQDIPDFGIGGTGYYPIPDTYSKNHCNKGCNYNFLDAIITYNKKRDIGVFDKLDCSCRKDWKLELTQSAKPLKERINEQLSKVETMIKDYHYDESNTGRISRVILAGEAQ